MNLHPELRFETTGQCIDEIRKGSTVYLWVSVHNTTRIEYLSVLNKLNALIDECFHIGCHRQ